MDNEKPYVIDAVVPIIGGEFYSLDYFFDLHPQAEIQKIDGKDYIGRCVECRAVVLDGDTYFDWTDEIACVACENKRKNG